MGSGGGGLGEWLEGISCGGLLGGLDDYGVETVGDLLLLDPPDIKALAGTMGHPPALRRARASQTACVRSVSFSSSAPAEGEPDCLRPQRLLQQLGRARSASSSLRVKPQRMSTV